MTLQQFRYILALDKHRHFGRAAQACHVAQPTLTLQLQKLEEELEVQLFDRSANPVAPTLIGKKVIAQARIILNEVTALKQQLSEAGQQMAGTFRLGIIPTLSPYLLPLFIQDFGQKNTEVHLQIYEMQSEEIIQGLLDDSLDIGLLVTPLEERQLREQVLFYEPFLIYATPEADILQYSPLLPDHIQREDLWILRQGHCFRNQVLNICGDELLEKSINPNVHFEAGSIETLKNMVRYNLGYTIIPELSVDPNRDASHIKRFAEPQPTREVSLVVNKNFHHERLLHELSKAIIKVIPDNIERNTRIGRLHWR